MPSGFVNDKHSAHLLRSRFLSNLIYSHIWHEPNAPWPKWFFKFDLWIFRVFKTTILIIYSGRYIIIRCHSFCLRSSVAADVKCLSLNHWTFALKFKQLNQFHRSRLKLLNILQLKQIYVVSAQIQWFNRILNNEYILLPQGVVN